MTTPELHEIDDEPGTAVAVITTDSQIDSQIATAKQYPRSVAAFRRKAEELACMDEEIAGDCTYALKRGGKVIEGPSARFAEIVLYAWGNSRAEAEVVEEGATHVTAQGTFLDLERNVAVRKKVQRRITDKHGRRYDEDMIAMTGNAAVSIALRNAVFAGIPKAFWKAVYAQARLASVGKAGTLTQKRQKLLEYFAKMGVTPEQVFKVGDVRGIEDIGEDQLITLRGLANAIKDGEQTVEEVFNPRATEAANTPDLNARIRDREKPKEG